MIFPTPMTATALLALGVGFLGPRNFGAGPTKP